MTTDPSINKSVGNTIKDDICSQCGGKRGGFKDCCYTHVGLCPFLFETPGINQELGGKSLLAGES